MGVLEDRVDGARSKYSRQQRTERPSGSVYAEGIESIEQRDRLWALGCTAGQGHLFSRPVPAERLIERLRRGHDGVPGRFIAPMPGGDVIRLPSNRRTDNRRDELS